MDAKKKEIVVKSNQLIEASYRLDLVEQRIILAAIVAARDSEKGLGEGFLTIRSRHFAQTFGMEEGSVYGQLKAALQSLYQRSVTFYDIDPESGMERVTQARWISSASYINGAGTIQLRFAPEMVPYITRLKPGFTQYRLERIGRMSSAHAVRLYELLAQYRECSERKIAIADLKSMLELDGEYDRLDNFKRRVVDVAVAQINEHSDLQVSYAQLKTGRFITDLMFKIKVKASAKKKDEFRSDQEYRDKLEANGQQRIDAEESEAF